MRKFLFVFVVSAVGLWDGVTDLASASVIGKTYDVSLPRPDYFLFNTGGSFSTQTGYYGAWNQFGDIGTASLFSATGTKESVTRSYFGLQVGPYILGTTFTAGIVPGVFLGQEITSPPGP